MRKILVIAITLIMIFSLSSCSTNKSDEVETDEAVIENEETNEETEMSEEEALIRDAKGISIRNDFNPQEESWQGASYELHLYDDKCTFNYYDFNTGEELTSDYTVDVFEEVIDMICADNPEEYENKADENGKIIYETVPHMLDIFTHSKHHYLKEPSNMNEILEKFESFKESADPVQY